MAPQIVGGLVGLYIGAIALEKKLSFKPNPVESEEHTSGDIPDVEWFDGESPKLDENYVVVQESHDEPMMNEPKTLSEVYHLMFDVD